MYLAGLTLNKLATGFGKSLANKIGGIEGFNGLPFPPQTDRLTPRRLNNMEEFEEPGDRQNRRSGPFFLHFLAPQMFGCGDFSARICRKAECR